MSANQNSFEFDVTSKQGESSNINRLYPATPNKFQDYLLRAVFVVGIALSSNVSNNIDLQEFGKSISEETRNICEPSTREIEKLNFIPVDKLIDKSDIDLDLYQKIKERPEARPEFIDYISKKFVDAGIDVEEIIRNDKHSV